MIECKYCRRELFTAELGTHAASCAHERIDALSRIVTSLCEELASLKDELISNGMSLGAK